MSQSPNKKGDHSLSPDMISGWKPHLTHQHSFKQFPIYFTNPETDMLSKSLTSFGTNQPYRVVYMGPRYVSNFKAYTAYSKKYDSEDVSEQTDIYGEHFEKFDFKFHGEKEKIFTIRPLQYRLFTGMNPTLKKMDLQFDANFQCGNLDLAVAVSPCQYDLLMRVDSNTKGHMTWFYFKVTGFTSKQKVRFNIINFQKSGLLYNQGMKPYCFRSSKKQWCQEGTEISFAYKSFRYQKLEQDEDPKLKMCLSFTYEFSKEDSYVYFAYCVPYSYSFLMHQVSKLQKDNSEFVFVDHNRYSTGGLVLPVLTITNPASTVEKQTCMAIGRLHPGETQGSWLMDGFLKFLCSPKGHYLREKFIFKIIPMVNVDGVVLGNFRTSIGGRDLNRCFHLPSKYQEVELVRSIADKSKPILFLDFHGHSGKKNVFMYGPNYGVDHRQFLTCRLLPKLVSKVSNAFRYYSCIFKISTSKINASRSVMIRQHQVTYAFTIEGSSYAFGPRLFEQKFNKDIYRSVGEKIGESLVKFFIIVFKLPKRLIQQNQTQQSDKKALNSSAQKSPTSKNKNRSNKEVGFSNLFDLDKSMFQATSQERELFQELLKDQETISKEEQQGLKNGEGSDSDFEQGCDYSDKQLKKLMKADSDNTLNKSQISSYQKNIKNSKNKSKLKNAERSPKSQAAKQLPSLRVIERSSELSNKKTAPIREKGLHKSKVVSVHEIASPVMPKFKSSMLGSSVVIENQLENSVDFGLNRVHYRNWKKYDSESPEVHPSVNFNKAKSVNHINLGYSLLDNKMHQAEFARKLEREKSYIGKRLKKSMLAPEKETREQRKLGLKRQGNSQQAFLVKRSILPVLNKKSFNQRKSNISFLEQLLDSNYYIQGSYPRKNLKIMYP